jgi:serine/threonine protein kinase
MPDETTQPGGSSGAPLEEVGASIARPEKLDYEVLRMIGRGSYGSVWLVREAGGAYRACKVVYREQFDHDRPYEREYAGIQRFEPVSRFNRSQVKILHVGRRDEAGYFYYLMELGDDVETGQEINPDRYVPKTLKSELVRRGRLPVEECVRIGLSLCAALENLHDNGLMHRDIKPGNIIFINGTPKLADIGLVTEAGHTISYVGTSGFIPPEGPTSPQADLYGLGKVLYEITTGMDRLDFPELPTDLGEFPDREAVLEINAVVVKACESDVRRRYQSAREMSADLALLQSGKSVRRARRAKRRWALAARMGLAMMVMGLAVAGVIYAGRKPPQTRVRPAPPSVSVSQASTPAPQTLNPALPPVPEIIIDSPQANYTGNWISGGISPEKHGLTYRYARTIAGTDTPTATATFTPVLSAAGDYHVDVWYSKGDKRSAKAKYQIVYRDGSIEVLVDQNKNSARWVRIGRALKFASGTNGFVRLRNDTGESDKLIIADAVRFLPAN